MSIFGIIRDWLIDPIGLLFLLSLLFLAVLAYKRITLCLIVATCIWVGAVFFTSAPLVVNPMLLYFENQFEETPECLQSRPIVVLGGGVDAGARSAADAQYMDHATFKRTLKARELARQFPSAPVFIAGGTRVEITEAAVIAHFLEESGIDRNRLYEEGRSTNTFENAINTKELLDKNGFDSHITLVTSALHMKRAKAVFEKQGVQVCPVAVDRHGIPGIPFWAVWPQISTLNKFDLLLHEVIGLFLYKVTDRI